MVCSSFARFAFFIRQIERDHAEVAENAENSHYVDRSNDDAFATASKTFLFSRELAASE
jgi:hypothetical protein